VLYQFYTHAQTCCTCTHGEEHARKRDITLWGIGLFTMWCSFFFGEITFLVPTVWGDFRFGPYTLFGYNFSPFAILWQQFKSFCQIFHFTGNLLSQLWIITHGTCMYKHKLHLWSPYCEERSIWVILCFSDKTSPCIISFNQILITLITFPFKILYNSQIQTNFYVISTFTKFCSSMTSLIFSSQIYRSVEDTFIKNLNSFMESFWFYLNPWISSGFYKNFFSCY